jgi:dihydroorotate dehydrogenase
MYKLLRSILFLFPTEWVHYFSMNCLKLLCGSGFIRNLLINRFDKSVAAVNRQAFHLVFKNPVGLGAGFDKNARYLRELETLGFGFVEIGTVTPLAQAGNEKPRLFRLPKDKALINRMGFNNDGVKVIGDRLRQWKRNNYPANDNQSPFSEEKKRHGGPAKKRIPLIIGGNIGKNKMTPNDEAWKDYEICFRQLFDCVDYFVVNVSSPNTPGLRELQEKESLRKILSHLQTINNSYPHPRPILLKIAPDLTVEQIDDVIDLALEIQLDGLVAANTTVSRDGLLTPGSRVAALGAGGVSGKPVKKVSTGILKYIHQKTEGKVPVIASGGIFNAEDADEKFEAGAVLVQVWTGFIYEGPGLAGKIVNQLLTRYNQQF